MEQAHFLSKATMETLCRQHGQPLEEHLLCTTVELPTQIHVWLLYCGGASSEVSPSLSCSEGTLIAPSHCLGLAVNYCRLDALNVQ